MILRKRSDLQKMGHLILQKEILRKINSIKDKIERDDTLKHSIIIGLKDEYHHLVHDVKSLKDNEHELTISRMLHLIPSKIAYFEIEYNKKEFMKIYNQLKLIRKEVNDVQSIKTI